MKSRELGALTLREIKSSDSIYFLVWFPFVILVWFPFVILVSVNLFGPVKKKSKSSIKRLILKGPKKQPWVWKNLDIW